MYCRRGRISGRLWYLCARVCEGVRRTGNGTNAFIYESAHIFFADFKASARYYALNILEELDSPNEVYDNIIW